MSQKIEYIPITMDLLELLKQNSIRKSFLLDFADIIDEEIVCPKIYIGFPSNIPQMLNHFRDVLNQIKNESSEEEKNNSNNNLNSITHDHSSDTSYENETTIRRKMLSKIIKNLQLSIIASNKENFNFNSEDQDKYSINFDEESMEKQESNLNRQEHNNNLTKKFKIKRERYFYMKHKENQPFMDIIQNIINKKHLTYSISPEYFILEAENVNYVANLDDSLEQIQDLINDQLKFLKGQQHVQSFHAMKKIFHSLEYRDKFVMLKYLKYKHLADKQIEYLIFYFKENKKKALKFQKFLLERDCSKIQIVKMKYNTFVKGKKYKPLNERSDFKILKDEGEFVSKYFKKYKQNDIINEIKNNDSFKNSDCKFLVFESPIPESQYETSIVFHWQCQNQSSENNNQQVILEYLRSLKKDFYSDNKFCFFQFQKNLDKQFPFSEFKADQDKQSLFSLNFATNLYKINIFGKANQITQFIDNNLNTFMEFHKVSKTFYFILKICNFDNEYIVKNIMSKKWAEGLREFERYKNEDTCQYYCVNFDYDLEFVKILQIIKKLLKVNFPK